MKIGTFFVKSFKNVFCAVKVRFELLNNAMKVTILIKLICLIMIVFMMQHSFLVIHVFI